MQPSPIELFIVLEGFSRRSQELTAALTPLFRAADEGPLVVSSVAFYRHDTDVALLAVRFFARTFTPSKMSWLLSLLEQAGLLVLNPDRLPDSDRRSFYLHYLASYRSRHESQVGPRQALEELAMALRKPSRDMVHRAVTLPPSLDNRAVTAQASSISPSGHREPTFGAWESLAPQPVVEELSNSLLHTANTSNPRISERSSGVAEPVADAQLSSAQVSGAHASGAHASGAHASGAQVSGAHASPPRRAEKKTDAKIMVSGRYEWHRTEQREKIVIPQALSQSGRAKARTSAPPAPHHEPSSAVVQAQGTPPAGEAMQEVLAPYTQRPRAPSKSRALSEIATGVFPGVSGQSRLMPEISTKFLRGDHWASARLRNINLHGASLATNAPPRAGDRVRIAVQIKYVQAIVNGTVVEVALAPTQGISGFTVSFQGISSDERDQLVQALTEAKNAGVSLRPPPKRAWARFPVVWPTHVTTMHGSLNMHAMDISQGGLFLASPMQVPETDLAFRLPLDMPGPAISGRATVARAINEEVAAVRGMAPGYGVKVVQMSAQDSMLWHAFLSRIEMRSEKRVIVAGRSNRTTALAQGLASAGYCVSTSNDTDTLMSESDSALRPPDVAVFDEGLTEIDPAARRLQSLFVSRAIPCIGTLSEDPLRTRIAVDKALQIL